MIRSFLLLAFLPLLSAGCGLGGETFSTGGMAEGLLRDGPFTSLTVEIQAVEGFEPTQEALNNLKAFLEERLHKSGGVEIVVDSPIPFPGKTSYSLSDIQVIEDENRLHFSEGENIAVYYLFIDGDSDQNSGSTKILGYAYADTSVVIYEKTILELSGGVGQPPTAILETTLMEHEFGHLLGLVNNGTPIQSPHHDAEHGAHCTVESCLMHYQVETSNIIANLLGGSIPELDPACREDLQANGGK